MLVHLYGRFERHPCRYGADRGLTTGSQSRVSLINSGDFFGSEVLDFQVTSSNCVCSFTGDNEYDISPEMRMCRSVGASMVASGVDEVLLFKSEQRGVYRASHHGYR